MVQALLAAVSLVLVPLHPLPVVAPVAATIGRLAEAPEVIANRALADPELGRESGCGESLLAQRFDGLARGDESDCLAAFHGGCCTNPGRCRGRQRCRDRLPMDSQQSAYAAEEALSGPPPLERPTTTERFRGFVQQPPCNSALGHRAERPTAALFLSPDRGRAAARQHICA